MTTEQKPLTDSEPDTSPELPSRGQKPLWQISTLVYAGFAAVGLLVGFFVLHNLPEIMHFPLQRATLTKVVGGGLLAAGIMIVMGFLFEEWFTSFREARSAMIRILGPVSPVIAVYLAIISALGEELLFRGALQPYAGLTVTAVLFGLLHIGPGGEVSAWAIWAAAAGALLGWLFQETGTLWTSIIAHFAVNCFSILRLRVLYRKVKEAPVEKQLHPTDLRP